MYVREALGGHRDGLDCRWQLPDHFGAPALLAVRNQFGDVALHEWQGHSAAHQLSRCLGARVCEVVKGGEQLSAVGCQYQWPGVGSAGVAEELGPSELNLL